MRTIAVIGAGYWGKNLVRNFNEIKALAAICEKDPIKQQEYKKEYPSCLVLNSFSDVLRNEEIKGIAIATPAETHGNLVREALLAGKDVFVEKPLALSASTAEELVSLAEKKKCILMVGHLLWYHPATLKLQALINSGELGRIQYIYSKLSRLE